MKDIHHVQQHILTFLLIHPSCRFSDLCPSDVSTDHFTFHVKETMKLGYVEKSDDGSYVLTAVGKEYANRYDIDSGVVRLEKQAKVCVLVKPMRFRSDGSVEHVIQRRLKEPFYGFYGSLGGKVKYGETAEQAAKRELQEEAGLDADVELYHIHHRTDVRNGDILEDKFFFIYRAVNIQGELLKNFDSGENDWMTIQEVMDLPQDIVFNGLIEGLLCAESMKKSLYFDEVVNEADVF